MLKPKAVLVPPYKKRNLRSMRFVNIHSSGTHLRSWFKLRSIFITRKYIPSHNLIFHVIHLYPCFLSVRYDTSRQTSPVSDYTLLIYICLAISCSLTTFHIYHLPSWVKCHPSMPTSTLPQCNLRFFSPHDPFVFS